MGLMVLPGFDSLIPHLINFMKGDIMKENEQIKGWFSVFGASGQTLQTIFTVVMAIIVVVALIFLIYKTFTLLPKWSSDDPEVRKEAKKSFVSTIVIVGIVVVITLIPTVLWNTVGKFSIAKDQIK